MAKISYFSHDSNARNSEKLLNVRMKYGAAGYGIYFMIIERLREEVEYMSVTDYNVIAFDLRVDSSVVKAIVEDFGLFDFTEDGEFFYSESLMRRMSAKDNISKSRSAAGKKAANIRWERERKKKEQEMKAQSLRPEFIANAQESGNKRITNAQKSYAKEKKRKERNIDIERLSVTNDKRDFISALSFYQNNYPTQNEQDKMLIAGYVSEYGVTDVLSAMQMTLDQKKSSMKYTGGILRNWRKCDQAGVSRNQGGGSSGGARKNLGGVGNGESESVQPSKFAGRWRKGIAADAGSE
ncbi:MAG: DUF4373 domain-containing protein [Negativicoccus succinicivorans]|uniref:Lin1244/Lin1753 domain-containing protein n=1 Tax=Negativicoccus succinicivorans TaxID=620903 RepID=UPI002912E7DC|nr:Lin1244/Lin1753 domain-containing protein [Negativicoccus succinicivorans]MDU5395716.1 DUF4373 domain-containing protein [Negativicoccus succinicivorans]